MESIHWVYTFINNKSYSQFGSPIESGQYNLEEVAAEVSTENKEFHAELQGIFKMASEIESNGDKVNSDTSLKYSVSL